MFGVTSTSIVLLTITLLSPLIEVQGLNMQSARQMVIEMLRYFDFRVSYGATFTELNSEITYNTPNLESLVSISLGILNIDNIEAFKRAAKKEDMRETINKYEDNFKILLIQAGIDTCDDNIPMEKYLKILRSASGIQFGLNIGRATRFVLRLMDYLNAIIPYGDNFTAVERKVTNESSSLRRLKINSVGVLGNSNVENFKEAAKENDMRAEIDKYISDFAELLEEIGVTDIDDNIPMMSYLKQLRAESETAFSS